ncbi:hypothetical protein LTR37_001731 [Vermiconidia calcicola]|uniref:Uncharacterized protein n=1 Tax=Vermiconidia calcicola TaxID=1690605 RepID=A0ACC3NUK9_9PEZI|nr:hypothetical protein LTR37_001731 [Vermiconidia calcicola]
MPKLKDTGAGSPSSATSGQVSNNVLTGPSGSNAQVSSISGQVNNASAVAKPPQGAAAPPPSNPWANGGGNSLAKSIAGKQSMLKSVTTKQAYSMAASQRGTAPPSSAMSFQYTGSPTLRVASQVGQMNVGPPPNDPNYPYYNPSCAPSSSMMSTQYKGGRSQAPSNYSTRSRRYTVNTAVCKLSGNTRRDFRKGDIIALPFHTANNNPNVDLTDRRLTNTCEGPAYSKRRMMVVMWLHEQDMFCLPLYTFGFKGLASKPEYIKREYVCMMNYFDKDFWNQGPHRPVKVDSHRPMDPNTTVHITGGREVSYQGDVHRVGRLLQDSYYDLFSLWQDLSEDAQAERW